LNLFTLYWRSAGRMNPMASARGPERQRAPKTDVGGRKRGAVTYERPRLGRKRQPARPAVHPRRATDAARIEGGDRVAEARRDVGGEGVADPLGEIAGEVLGA